MQKTTAASMGATVRPDGGARADPQTDDGIRNRGTDVAVCIVFCPHRDG